MITPVSLKLWKSSGRRSLHSIDAGMCGLAITLRCAANASHTTTMNIRRETNDAMAPIDDRTFHVIMASG